MISRYCGIYGTTPPKIIRHEAITLRNSCKLMPNIDIWLFVIVVFNIRTSKIKSLKHHRSRIVTMLRSSSSAAAKKQHFNSIY